MCSTCALFSSSDVFNVLLVFLFQALASATDAQRALLKAHYGKHDPASVERVKALYSDLGLEARFNALEQETYARRRSKIDAATASGDIPAEVFLSLLHKIYKRSK